MFITDEFIECIRQRPQLWNRELKEYRDKHIREKLWLEIGGLVFKDWSELGLEEKNDRVKEMKNKWRHIRDNFFKHLNEEKNTDSASNKKKRKYVHQDSLQFLIDCGTRKQYRGYTREENENSGDTDNNASGIQASKQAPNKIATRSQSARCSMNDTRRPPCRNQPPAKVNSALKLDEDIADCDGSGNIEVLKGADNEAYIRTRKGVPAREASQWQSSASSRNFNNTGVSSYHSQTSKKVDAWPKCDEEDADKSYFMSILPNFRELNDEEKIDFRIMVLEYFRDTIKRRKLLNSTPGPSSEQLDLQHSVPSPTHSTEFAKFNTEIIDSSIQSEMSNTST